MMVQRPASRGNWTLASALRPTVLLGAELGMKVDNWNGGGKMSLGGANGPTL